MSNKNYAKLEDVQYVLEKLLTNDRIEILENRVRELENEKSELLSNSEKEAVIEHKEKFTPTANQKRGKVIWKAKQFINQHSNGMGLFEFGYIQYKIEFKIKKSKRTVEALLIGEYTGHVHKRVKVTCHPDEVFNEYLGKAIAIGRLLELDVSHFEDAPQPDKVAVGQVLESKYNKAHTWKVVSIEKDSISLTIVNSKYKNCINGKSMVSLSDIEWVIFINDTNAQYSLLHK